MQQRKTLNRVLSVAALAMLFGAGSIHAQTGTSTSDAPAASTSGVPDASSASGSSGMSGSSGASGSSDTSGAAGSSGASDSSGASGSSGSSGMSGSSGASGSSDASSSSGAAGGSAQSSSGASDSTSGAAKSGGQLSKADQNIMREMARANMAEIAAANIALKQSKNDEVKSFAQKMIDDHTKAQQELEQLAQAKGVTLPTEPDRKHQAMAKKLEAIEGDKFDKQYLSQGGVKDHRETHRMLSRAQDRATDPELKALVQKMEPIVGDHMKMAQDTQSGKGTASGSSMGPAGTSSSSGAAGSQGSAGSSDTSGASGSSSPSGTSGSSSPSGTSGSSDSSGSSSSPSPGK